MKAPGKILDPVAEFVITEVDDILITGESIKQLQDQISKLLTVCRDGRFELSRKKVQAGTKIIFTGLLLMIEEDELTIGPNPG